MNVAAVVVLYNPNDEVFENIASYADKVELLIVIDNSTQHNKALIDKLQTYNIYYQNNNTNKGIASALKETSKIAIEKGYKYLLTMDQDSSFINFSHYLKCIQNNIKQDIGVFAANTVRNAKSHLPQNPTCCLKEKDFVITSANIINLQALDEVGNFEEKLFIDAVDFDICAKFRKNGYKILFFNDVLVEHALGELQERKNILTGKKKLKRIHSPQRAYYIVRNNLFLAKMHGKAFPKEFGYLKVINTIFIHDLTKIILYEPDKWKKIKAKWLGLFHFLTNKFGKYELGY